MNLAPTEDLVARRRAVEALRSGVPSRDAVAALGSGQPEAEDRFAALLEQVREPGASLRGHPGCCLAEGSALERATSSPTWVISPCRTALS